LDLGLSVSVLSDFPLLFSPLLSFFWVFFFSSLSILQMANMRNCNANAKNNTDNNDAANLPPPPLPGIEQVLAMQAWMLQTMLNMQNAQSQAPPLLLRDRLGHF
jgi:hypothetical protein